MVKAHEIEWIKSTEYKDPLTNTWFTVTIICYIRNNRKFLINTQMYNFWELLK